MVKLGFNEHWISRVMTCVTITSCGVLINDAPGSTIYPSRGIWKGSPLFPYLYLICAEGLSCLLHEAEQNSILKGVKKARGNPFITHLFFADDCLIFCRANVAEWQYIQRLLDSYELVSGQGINKHKSGIFFSSNTKGPTGDHILNLAQVLACRDHQKYLGLPLLIGRKKYCIFEGSRTLFGVT